MMERRQEHMGIILTITKYCKYFSDFTEYEIEFDNFELILEEG